MYFLFIFIFLFPATSNGSTDLTEKSACDGNFSIQDASDSVYPAIMNGYPATIREFPYAVRLYVLRGHSIVFCTGQAVTPSLIITAAHCLENYYSALVVTGHADQSDYVRGKNLKKYARYLVRYVYVHPKFDRSRLLHDVAILKLGRRMLHDGRAWVNVSYADIDEEEFPSTVYGWGGTSFDPNNNRLYAKKLPSTECKTGLNDSYSYLCLLKPGICRGDSGGGLIYQGNLVGIASFEWKAGRGYEKQGEYYYIWLHKEVNFVRDTIRRNASNYNKAFFNVIQLLLFTFIIIIL